MPQNGIGQSPLSATFGLKGRIVACILLFLNAGISWAQGIEWPEGKKAAVVLTYDDALESQLVHAAPALEKHGFRGTFFLDEHRVEPANFHRWADVAKKGHELGNHSLFHPGHSSYAFIKDSGYAIDEYTP
jgi:peptidoglycan/xylan/chitin deacetylase (PgdA/CDA1 family)